MCSCIIEFIKQVWGKEIKCEACRSFKSFFCNEPNKFNNTEAVMLDYYHMTQNYFEITF